MTNLASKLAGPYEFMAFMAKKAEADREEKNKLNEAKKKTMAARTGQAAVSAYEFMLTKQAAIVADASPSAFHQAPADSAIIGGERHEHFKVKVDKEDEKFADFMKKKSEAINSNSKKYVEASTAPVLLAESSAKPGTWLINPHANRPAINPRFLGHLDELSLLPSSQTLERSSNNIPKSGNNNEQMTVPATVEKYIPPHLLPPHLFGHPKKLQAMAEPSDNSQVLHKAAAINIDSQVNQVQSAPKINVINKPDEDSFKAVTNYAVVTNYADTSVKAKTLVEVVPEVVHESTMKEAVVEKVLAVKTDHGNVHAQVFKKFLDENGPEFRSPSATSGDAGEKTSLPSYSGDMIKFVVGRDWVTGKPCAEFFVIKELISHYSTVVKASLNNSRSTEAKTQTFTLFSTEKETFELFLRWLHGVLVVPTSKTEITDASVVEKIENGENGIRELMSLWLLARELGVASLQMAVLPKIDELMLEAGGITDACVDYVAKASYGGGDGLLQFLEDRLRFFVDPAAKDQVMGVQVFDPLKVLARKISAKVDLVHNLKSKLALAQEAQGSLQGELVDTLVQSLLAHKLSAGDVIETPILRSYFTFA